MQKISQLICLILFFVLVATTGMAQKIVNQAEVADRLHHLIKKRSSHACGVVFGNITICDTRGNDCLDIIIPRAFSFVLCDFPIDYPSGNGTSLNGTINICTGGSCNGAFLAGCINIPGACPSSFRSGK
jgi:hypothetical protein